MGQCGLRCPCSFWTSERKQPRGRRNDQQTEEVVEEWWLWCLQNRWYGWGGIWDGEWKREQWRACWAHGSSGGYHRRYGSRESLLSCLYLYQTGATGADHLHQPGGQLGGVSACAEGPGPAQGTLLLPAGLVSGRHYSLSHLLPLCAGDYKEWLSLDL